MTTLEMELGLMAHFNARTNLIVPNVHWGANIHEIDLFVLSKSGYAYEVEIKISKADLIKDKEKRHGHIDRLNRIKHLWFAIPEKLVPDIEHIPERAGIVVVGYDIATYNKWVGDKLVPYDKVIYPCKVLRQPQLLSTHLWSDKDRYNIARLGALRIWSMKEKILRLTNA